MALILKDLEKALKSLHNALKLSKDDIVRDAAIQRFEYTYEIAWKLIQRWLKKNVGAEAVDALSKKDLFRMGAEKGLIDDPLKWFEYHEARNLASHTYNEMGADGVYYVAKRFAVDAENLLQALKKKND